MDGFTDVLSKKIAALCEHVRKLKADNTKLAEDNAQLRVRVKELEKSLDSDHKRSEKLDKERVLVKTAIDELVENIDALIGKERQSS